MKLPTIWLPAIHSPLSHVECIKASNKFVAIWRWKTKEFISPPPVKGVHVFGQRQDLPRFPLAVQLRSTAIKRPAYPGVADTNTWVVLALVFQKCSSTRQPCNHLESLRHTLYAMLHPVLQGCQSVLRPLWSDSHHGLLGVPVWLQCVPGEWVTAIWCPRVTKQREIETRPVRTLASTTTLEESLPIGMENRQSTTAPLGWNL